MRLLLTYTVLLVLAGLLAACGGTPDRGNKPALALAPCQLAAPGVADRMAAKCATLTVFEDRAAQRLGTALAPLVRRNAAPGEIDQLIEGLLDGSAHVPTTEQQAERDAERPDNAAFSFEGVRRAVVLGRDGVVLASSGAGAPAPGAALPVAEAARLGLLVEQVRAGGCTPGRPADGPLIDSAACAILDDRGALIAIVIVENSFDGRTQWSVAIVRIMSMALAVTGVMFGIIPIAIVVVLVVSLGVGYLLARRLTRRLELLAAATGDVAGGDLDRRVAVDSPDEVGRLGADFNVMAARLKERERALADEAARTDALLRANRRLVANVSHELRTPLATLRGYLEALEQEHGDHLPAHDLEVIQREARRLTELIDDLFTLARAEAQQLPLTIETVDAGALAHRLVGTLAPLARRERQIEVVAALPSDLPLVRADRARLEQVLLNLAQNALRHTPPGGIVAIEGAADEAGMVTLAVADTGGAFQPRSCRWSSSASTAATARARARPAAPAWGWRWCRSWSRRWAAR